MKPSPNADTTILFVKGEGRVISRSPVFVVPHLGLNVVVCLQNVYPYLQRLAKFLRYKIMFANKCNGLDKWLTCLLLI